MSKSSGQRPSESEFARLADNIPTPFAFIDADERYLFVNPQCEKALQARREELLGRPLRETVSESAYALMRVFFQRALRGESVEFEIGLRRPGQGPIWLVMNFVPHRNEAGEVDGLFTFSSDITAQQGVRDVLQSKRGALAHTLRLNTAGELARAWAHQISQPLDAIAGFVEECIDLLQEPDFDVQTVSDLLGRGSACALRAGEIVHGIRGFLRTDPVQHTPADLRDVVRDATELIRGEAEMGDCPILVTLPAENIPILCDRTQLRQACLNILRNALDATAPTHADDHNVSVVVQRHPEGFGEVIVRDHGTDMDAALDDRAFESFFSTKGRLGLGLTIAQSIVESHDGQISIEPREDTHPGCTARLRLPLKAVAP